MEKVKLLCSCIVSQYTLYNTLKYFNAVNQIPVLRPSTMFQRTTPVPKLNIKQIIFHFLAKVDLVTVSEKQSAMHYAAKYNSLETMKVLIKFQGSFTQRDGKNRTVLFLAAEQGIFIIPLDARKICLESI